MGILMEATRKGLGFRGLQVGLLIILFALGQPTYIQVSWSEVGS